MTAPVPTERDINAFREIFGFTPEMVAPEDDDAIMVIARHAAAAREEALGEVVAWLRGPFIQGRHPEDAAFARHVALAIERRDHLRSLGRDGGRG